MRLRNTINHYLNFGYRKYSIIFSIRTQNGCKHCTHEEKNLWSEQLLLLFRKLISFFQEKSASLSSAGKPFSSDLKDWKVKILPLDVNHDHASRSHWVYQITKFISCQKFFPLFRPLNILQKYYQLVETLMFISMQKLTPSLTSFFWDYFEYFENAWSCPSIMTVSPYRKLCDGQNAEINLLETLMFICMQKNRLHHSLLSWDISKK